MPKVIEPTEVAALLKPGMRVYVGGGACEPHGLIEALRSDPAGGAGVTFMQSIIPGLTRTDFTALHADARILTFFMTTETQAAYDDGKVDFLPMQLRVISQYLRETPLDVALIQLAPTSDPNVYSPGLNADYVDAILANAKCIIGELNPQLPVVEDIPGVPAERVDYLMNGSYPIQPFPLVEPSETAIAVGQHIATLVKDGDCLQTGIGAIPYAVLSELTEKNDLGLHSGLIDDAAKHLVELGVLTGARKNREQGKHVAAAAIGTTDMYEWVANCPDVRLRPYSYTHDASVLLSLENFVSINSAMEVDLYGQVNSEMIKGRQITGTGGSVDFIRGAGAGKGGRSIIALTATAVGGKLSRIIPKLASGNAATALRTDVDYIVTEYGIAHLRYLPVHARAQALIEIAAPEFRSELRAQASEMFGR